jgi:hypothetical protein
MNTRKIRIVLYAALTLIGTAGVMWFNIRFMLAGGFDSPTGFVDAATVNAAGASVFVDIAVASAAGILLMVVEGRRVGVRHVWAYVLLSFVLAFAATFPAFLLARELRLAALEGAG